MSDIPNVRVLGIEREGEPYIWEYNQGPAGDGEFRVETLYSGLSAGTELTFLKGTNPYLHSRWDADRGVFRDGEPGAAFPVPFLGYMEVGRVVESRSPAVGEGEIVGMSFGHKSGHIAHGARDFFVPIPEDVDAVLGIYAAQMGPICANGILHAAAELFGTGVRDISEGVAGRRVLVTGAGVVGLLTALFARFYGAAEVAIADRTPARLQAAGALGLVPLDESEIDIAGWCKDLWHDDGANRGADVVFQCRGLPEYLQMALRCLRPQGAVIDLAFYQGGADAVRLGEEFHHNGLALRWSQIGRVPRGLNHSWNRARLASETMDLLRERGDLIREHLITDAITFDDAPEFMQQLAARERHSIQAVFEF